MLSPVVIGRVERGKFIPANPEVFKTAFRCHEKRRVSLEIKRFHAKRSNPLNRYYRGVVVPIIADYMGERDYDCVHEYLKYHFNFRPVMVGDKMDRIAKSTANLDNAEFIEFLDKVKEFAAKDLGLYIPDPNE